MTAFGGYQPAPLKQFGPEGRLLMHPSRVRRLNAGWLMDADRRQLNAWMSAPQS
ncbi:hypothetical protein [Yinghuangia seranimata]|uniref:hypothetical protein n=1 Tax=Yinghuangia seranimata TaxID=408067 RepID=UPI00248D303F|nr:hypothetical protein [Yinghuangia seranimata]MDI2127622.1 hypothetical protein [Yinghuangia seranimata]